MLKRILNMFRAARKPFVVLALIISPLWFLNLERWLESKGLDTLLVQSEGVMSDVILLLIGALSSDFSMGFVVGGLVAAFWSVLTHPLQSVRSLSKSSPEMTVTESERPVYASPFAGKEKTAAEVSAPDAPVVVTQRQQWPKTSDYDLPIKLRAIDDLLDVFGADRECEQVYREGVRLSHVWERMM